MKRSRNGLEIVMDLVMKSGTDHSSITDLEFVIGS